MARILHLSDLHAVAAGTRASGVLDTNALLRAAIDALSERLPAIGPIDAVLVTGDISDDGSADSYAIARAELARLGLPMFVIPGNHDRRAAFREAFADTTPMPEDGPLDWVADVAETRIIGLDTLVEGQGGGRLQARSLDHLAKELDQSEGQPVVVALHHPPLRTGIRFMDAIGLENAEALEGILRRHDGSLRVLAGHVHGVYHAMLGGHPVVTAHSTCSAFAFDRRREAPVGFMLGPLGFGVLDTAPGGVWTACPHAMGDGPYGF
jgi:3',5'-cyclic AMP phosphodiesterase CpdA